MEAWGVEFRTVAFVTAKDTQFGVSLAWGMGNWTRANAEIVLLGVRGKPKRVDAGVHQVVISPREKPHSRKSAEVRDRIDKLMGPGHAPGSGPMGKTSGNCWRLSHDRVR